MNSHSEMTERTIPRSRLLGKAFVVVISCARTCDVNDSGASRHRGSLVARAAGAAGGGGGWRAKAPPRPASGVVKPPKTYRHSTSGLFLIIARPRQGSKKPHGKSPQCNCTMKHSDDTIISVIKINFKTIFEPIFENILYSLNMKFANK